MLETNGVSKAHESLYLSFNLNTSFKKTWKLNLMIIAVRELFFPFRFGIRCNAVVPGFIDSPMTELMPEKVKKLFVTRIPIGRMGTPEGIIFFLDYYKKKKRFCA